MPRHAGDAGGPRLAHWQAQPRQSESKLLAGSVDIAIAYIEGIFVYYSAAQDS